MCACQLILMLYFYDPGIFMVHTWELSLDPPSKETRIYKMSATTCVQREQAVDSSGRLAATSPLPQLSMETVSMRF